MISKGKTHEDLAVFVFPWFVTVVAHEELAFIFGMFEVLSDIVAACIKYIFEFFKSPCLIGPIHPISLNRIINS